MPQSQPSGKTYSALTWQKLQQGGNVNQPEMIILYVWDDRKQK